MSDLETNRLAWLAGDHKRHHRPIWIWDRETGRFVWANAAGIAFWGADGLAQLQATHTACSHPAFITARQLLDEPPSKGRAEGQLVFPELPLPDHGAAAAFLAQCRLDEMKGRPVMIIEIERALSAPPVGEDTKDHDNYHQEALPQDEHSFPLDEIEDGDAHDVEGADCPHGDSADTPAHTPLQVEPIHRSDNALRQKEPLPPLSPPSLLATGLKHPLTSTAPLSQLDELAKMIEAAQSEVAQEVSFDKSKESSADPGAPSPSSTNGLALAEAAFAALDIDLTALKGASGDEEIEEILMASSAPLGLVHLPRIIHANDIFVSEFGYGDFTSLANDGTDWILPLSRDLLSPLVSGGEAGPLTLDEVRLCSGRSLKRPVHILPLKLTRFNRVLLLLLLGDEHQEGGVYAPGAGLSGLEIPGAGTMTGVLNEALNDIPLLSIINHEVRTPLTIILGFSEMMSRQEFGPLGHGKYLEYAHDIHASAEHALHLINDMLDLSKLKAGHWSIAPELLSLNEVVREEVHLMRGLAEERGVRLRSSLEENLPTVLVDKRVLLQILMNLISNALKFTPEAGVVTVSTQFVPNGPAAVAAGRPGRVELCIEDTGPGMSAAELEHVVHPFQQTDRGARQFGTGLGLPIVKALAKASKIGFSIVSEPERGTKITLNFPVK